MTAAFQVDAERAAAIIRGEDRCRDFLSALRTNLTSGDELAALVEAMMDGLHAGRFDSVERRPDSRTERYKAIGRTGESNATNGIVGRIGEAKLAASASPTRFRVGRIRESKEALFRRIVGLAGESPSKHSVLNIAA